MLENSSVSKRSCQNKMTLEVPKILFNKLGETELMKVLPTGRPSLTQEHVSFISLEKVCSEKPNRARRRGDATQLVGPLAADASWLL